MSGGNPPEVTAWFRRADERIARLNSAPVRVFEVGASGVVVAGDIELSKGDEDEFEATIEGVKPGIWAMHVDPDADADPSLEDPVPPVFLRWFAEGPLDYDALPNKPAASAPAPPTSAEHGADWPELGSFSVDSGSSGIFDQDALEPDRLGIDRETALEHWSDASGVVPGGISFGGNDGGYYIFGRRDENELIVEIKLQQP